MGIKEIITCDKCGKELKGDCANSVSLTYGSEWIGTKQYILCPECNANYSKLHTACTGKMNKILNDWMVAGK